MSAPATARAVLDLDVPGPVLSRHLYGHFAEHLGGCIYGGFYVGPESEIPNQDGIRLDVVEALRELGIPNLRWPGGCFADEYHWKDGVGPKQDRPRMINTHWGDVEENNHFGTHEFMALCELLGADPYITGNLGSGTVAEMSEWVEYLTRDGDSPMVRARRANGREDPWRVPFWGLGNESWGCGGNQRAEAYADLARQYATYCRDHGDNRLYKIAVGPDQDDYHWTETLMKAVGTLGCSRNPRGYFQAIALHMYTVLGSWEHKGSATAFDTDDYYATLVRAARMDELITRHSSIMDCYDPGRQVGLVVDEWGTWWDVEPGTNPGFLYQQNTLRDALVAGLHFDIFHAHAERVVMANIAQTVNVLQAMLLTDPATNALVRTPTFHVFAMNRGHHDATRLRTALVEGPDARPVGEGSLDLVSLSASRKDGTALVSVSNLDADRELELVLDVRGGAVAGHTARVLTAPTLQTHNTAEQPDAVAPTELTTVTDDPRGLRVTLPAHSFATVSLTLA
ncbi:alpha-N-arabinofuranosidase [Friedmanniella endophytica]|uniref:non-reducing end alpha-L-arabinofuranosidase n=1 Tax=Microlunatus kandeliicorticis TaxID=1759536 RepID=A0A7W3P4P5_9ACTN|nr:alpha-L-arabinofuranosidase C-terminal domain-containing protein [Microlunatus kandeliicorticis]MBA8793047.1 alpha-N-arabinofuranosidase [Microlunatus kandeliicorticis]